MKETHLVLEDVPQKLCHRCQDARVFDGALHRHDHPACETVNEGENIRQGLQTKKKKMPRKHRATHALFQKVFPLQDADEELGEILLDLVALAKFCDQELAKEHHLFLDFLFLLRD